MLIHWFGVHEDNFSQFAVSSSQSQIVGNPFPVNFAGGSNFICPQAPPTAGTGPGAAPPMRGDNGGGTWMKLVEDVAPGYTTC